MCLILNAFEQIDVEKVDLSTTMLGTPVDAPFYVTATALGKLGHPEGEVVLTRAAHKHNLIQVSLVSRQASWPASLCSEWLLMPGPFHSDDSDVSQLFFRRDGRRPSRRSSAMATALCQQGPEGHRENCQARRIQGMPRAIHNCRCTPGQYSLSLLTDLQGTRRIYGCDGPASIPLDWRKIRSRDMPWHCPNYTDHLPPFPLYSPQNRFNAR